MFSDVTPGQSGVPSGLDRDAKFPTMLRSLARRRQQNTSTDDVAAAFKESDRERKFSTDGGRVVGQ
jgi:hypothetical protein